MQTLRCKCGEKTIMTSMGSADCEGCEICKTTYASHPDYHEPLKEHQFITKYNQDTGKPYRRCNRCGFVEKESFQKSKEQ